MKYPLLHLPNFFPFMMMRTYADTPTLQTHVFGQYLHLKLWLESIRMRTWILLGALLIGLPIVIAAGLFVQPKQLAYSFASTDNCFLAPAFFPETLNNKTAGMKVSHPPVASIGSRPLFSMRTCVSLDGVPSEKSAQIVLQSPLGIKKTVTYSFESMPTLAYSLPADTPIGSKASMQFELSDTDATFSYTLTAGDKTSACNSSDMSIACPLAPLELQQGKSHGYQLYRTRGESRIVVLEGSVRLLDPISFSAKRIKNKSTVYRPVEEVVLTANKPIASAGDVVLREKGKSNAIKLAAVSVNGAQVLIKLDQPLAREKTFELTVDNAVASDDASQDSPYKLTFATSGGPKVKSVNIGTYNVSASSSFTLTFDVAIEKEAIARYISVSTTASAIGASISVSGKQVTIRPNASLSGCTLYSLRVKDGLQNSYGIKGASAWNHQFRTTCQQIFSIGTSEQGRSILGYRFGSGSNRVVFVGGMHGNERSSVVTMYAWIDELERNYSRIPRNFSVVVIPNHSPDSYVMNSRLNANGVDLNRNFPSNNWKKGVYIPPSTYLPKGGGSAPLSEKESKALASYIQSIGPRLVLTYHATASAVFSNGSGNSEALANEYGRLSGFSSYSAAEEDSIFAYETTGEFETWLHDKMNIPTLLVELATMSGNELATQRAAMWAMLK